MAKCLTPGYLQTSGRLICGAVLKILYPSRLFAESIVENRWRCSLVDSNIIILNHSDFARRREMHNALA